MTTASTVIDFVNGWRVKNGIHPDVTLTPAQTELFVRDLPLQLTDVSVRPTDPDGFRAFAPDPKPIPDNWPKRQAKTASANWLIALS